MLALLGSLRLGRTHEAAISKNAIIHSPYPGMVIRALFPRLWWSVELGHDTVASLAIFSS